MSPSSVRSGFAAVLAGALLGLATPALAQQGTITGRVAQAQNAQPIVGADVFIIGSNRRTATAQDGRYQFTEVPPGRVQVRVARIGYESQLHTFTLAPGQTFVADFQLESAVITLDEVVVTATGDQRKRELGHVIGGIQPEELVEQQTIPNMSDLLTGRVAGVQVLPDGGTIGSSGKIRIRGANSVSLSNEPIIYVDGVRVESRTQALTLDVGGQEFGRLNDLNPDEIESIEIVKGPAAATLYGTEAANGVIRITTKRGRPGPAQWQIWVEQGGVWDPNEYPAAWTGVDLDAPIAATRRFCALEFQASGFCQQDSVTSHNVLEADSTSPFGTGRRQQYGFAVSGGSEGFQYYVTAEFESADGSTRMPRATVDSLRAADIEIDHDNIWPNGFERVSTRGNFRARLANNADLSISAGYVTSEIRAPNNDNSSAGVLPSGYFGVPFPDDRGGWGFALPEESMRFLARQEVDRFTLSVNGNWQVTDWLSGRATTGVDITTFHDNRTDFVFASNGSRASVRNQLYHYTVDLGGSANVRLTPSVSSRTSIGVQYFRDLDEQTLGTGSILPAGCTSLACAAITTSDEETGEDITLGVYGEQQFGLNDRLFATVGIRVDDNSAFGENFDAVVYPKASVSWLISEESFFPTASFLSELRLRASVGASGLQPGTLENVQFFDAVPVTVPAGATSFTDAGGVTFGELGNLNLKPERSTEWEAGLDASLFGGRVGFEATWYYKKTTDALIERVLAPSLGASVDRFENIGSVRNTGIEGLLNAVVIDRPDIRWDVTATGSINDNKLLELGEDVEPFGGLQRFVEGYPLAGFWDLPIESFNDANGDGILRPSEIVVGDSLEFIGPPIPKRELTLQSGVSLWNLFRVQALFDFRGGHYLHNLTEEFRCDTFILCQPLHDASLPLEEQARAVATTFHPEKTSWGYVEKANFVKFRELSFTFFAPDAWAGRLGARRLSLSLSGRNLATWTDYSGMDPEINSNTDNFFAFEFLSQPPVRFFTARLNVTF